ncbi:hypothetical protein R1flu_019024 [Riccia fluitans]|uniref:Uncharacterized protein n=1 Tax=Riccia fluitans TaxID=41844 RepID=A0ABD1ZHH5_9MARC
MLRMSPAMVLWALRKEHFVVHQRKEDTKRQQQRGGSNQRVTQQAPPDNSPLEQSSCHCFSCGNEVVQPDVQRLEKQSLENVQAQGGNVTGVGISGRMF